jgi:hypothetical protein
MDNHMSGDIRLKDYDNLANIITYDPANPATLEPFCLGCHDTDGANGNMTPFSSPNVLGESTGRNQAGSKIESSWEKANGHRRQGLTCMGTGAAVTGCHGDSGAGTINAHGSDNNGLLVKKLTLPIGTSDWNESNFTLCLDCHANTLDKNIMSMKDLVIVANGGNYAQYGSDIFPYTGTNEFMVSGFHDYKAYNYDRQFNLHLYHLRNSTWRYRGIDPSYESCITCHNVHGVDGQDFYLWDEWHFFKEIDNGIEYGRFGFLPSMNGPLRYPNYCTNACHGVTWDEQYRYPRTNFNEAYAVASKSSGALGTNDTVTIQFSHSTNELSLVSGTSDTGPPFGIDKALPAGGGAKKWGTINAVWSNSAKTLTITISSPSAASPVSVNDLIQLAPYQGGMGLNEFTIYNWSILDLQGVPYRGKVTLKGN